MNCCMLLSNAIPMQLTGGLFDLSMPWTNHRDSATYIKLSFCYIAEIYHVMSYTIMT